MKTISSDTWWFERYSFDDMRKVKEKMAAPLTLVTSIRYNYNNIQKKIEKEYRKAIFLVFWSSKRNRFQ